jgi:DnaJ-class molecular chaperone
METLYDVLGIDSTADSETIRTAYREQAKRHHPDVSESSSKKFRRLTTARDVLLDERERTRYDALGHRRYARYHLGDDWPAEVRSRHTGVRQRSRSRAGATVRSNRRRRTRRTRRERPPRRTDSLRFRPTGRSWFERGPHSPSCSFLLSCSQHCRFSILRRAGQAPRDAPWCVGRSAARR